MPVFQNADEFYAVMGELSKQLTADPQVVAQFERSKMVLRFRCFDPDAELVLDGRHNPAKAYFGPDGFEGRVDLEIALKTDLLHDMWLGKIRVRDAFMNGQIKTSGNIFKALQLADLFRRAEALYPNVLQEMGYQA